MPAQPRVDVIIDADTKPFGAGIQNATSAARNFGSTINRYLGAAAVAGATRSVLQLASELSDLSLEAGVTIEWLQAAAHAAKMSGSGMQDVVMGMVKLRESMVQASSGSRSDIKAFEDLKISLSDLRTQSPEDVFLRIMDAIEKTGGRAKETAAAIALLGRSGKRLIPAAMNDFRGEMTSYRKNGRGISTEEAAALDNVGDMIDDTKERLKVMGAKAVLKGLPKLGWLGIQSRGLLRFIGDAAAGPIVRSMQGGNWGEELKSYFTGESTTGAWKRSRGWVADQLAVNEEKYAKNDADIKRRAAALRAMTNKPIGETGFAAPSRLASDAITRIGGFFGPSVGASQPRAEALLRPIHQQLAEIVRAVKENTATTRDSGL